MKGLKALQSIINKLEAEKNKLETLKEAVEEDRDKKQDSYDDKTEKWQEGEKGTVAYAAIEKLEEEIGYLEDAINELDSSLESLGAIDGVETGMIDEDEE